MTRNKTQEKGLTKKQRMYHRKFRHQRLAIFIGVAVIGLSVMGLLAFGYYQEYIVRPREPVATVGGVPIRTDTYQKMVRYRRFLTELTLQRLRAQQAQIDPDDEEQQYLAQYMDQQIQQVQAQEANLPMQALEELIDGELIRQEAAERGIEVTTEEVQKEIEEQFGYLPNPPSPTPSDATPVPTATPMTYEEFQRRYEEYLQVVGEWAGFSEADFHRLVETSLLERKLQEAFADQVPTTDEHVHARHILLETEEEAEAALARLEEGEDFEALTREISIDESTKEEGGDLGWFTSDDLGVPAEVVETAFSLKVEEISDAVKSQSGYHIIEVLGREERELDSFVLQMRQWKAFEDWLQEQRQSEEVQRNWSSDKVPPS